MDSFCCKTCKIIKPLNINFFKKETKTKHGFYKICKVCSNKRNSQKRKDNLHKYLLKEANVRKTPAYKKYHKSYYLKNKEKIKCRSKDRYYKDKEPFLKRSKGQKKRLGGKYKKYLKEYRIKNKDKLSKYFLNKYKNNLHYKIKCLISSRIRQLAKRNIRLTKYERYLGCSSDFFREYISSKFSNGMNWENHGKVWQLDHIIPCASFNLQIEENIFKCFNYMNYQPLFIEENLQKSDKMPDGTRGRNFLDK